MNLYTSLLYNERSLIFHLDISEPLGMALFGAGRVAKNLFTNDRQDDCQIRWQNYIEDIDTKSINLQCPIEECSVPGFMPKCNAMCSRCDESSHAIVKIEIPTWKDVLRIVSRLCEVDVTS